MLGKYADKQSILRSAEKAVLNQKFQQAIREYERFVELEAPDPGILNTIGDLLLKLNRTSEALGYFQQVAELYSCSGFALKAIATYRKIHNLNPSDPRINEILAELYYRQSFAYDAVHHLLLLVEHYRKANQIEQAIACLKKAIALAPADFNTRVLLAELLEQRDKKAEALEQYQEALTLCAVRGEWAQVFEVAPIALSLDEANTDILQRYVGAAQEVGRLLDAENFLTKRISVSGKIFPYQIFLAWICEKRGEPRRAWELYRDLEENGYAHPLIQEGLGRTGMEATPAAVHDAPPLAEPALERFALHSLVETSTASKTQGFFEITEQTETELVEDDEEAPTPTNSAVPADIPLIGSLEEALEEADFYLKLGFRDEARKLLEQLLRLHGHDERVLRRAEKAMLSVPGLEVRGEPASGQDVVKEITDDFDSELDSALEGLFTGAEEYQADEVLRYDVAAKTDQPAHSSPRLHYELGLAYKEMGLNSDALQEFLKAVEGMEDSEYQPQKLLCCSLLANTFLNLGNYDEAIRWAQAGLQIPERREFEWKALQYDLCLALEGKGDSKKALRGYREILKKDPSYRDVSRRISQLGAKPRDESRV
ncbi:MAG: tetratricopeptide repeat protein [Acidobacteria bacterium]|nr:tetratricopeptide repeat protein [Acidobacteriota bacterium]